MTKARDIASASPAPSTVSSTELGYLDGVTSAIQTQIDSKIGSASAISPTLIDAKGDLIVGSAADTAARLAVGTNNYVLTADSSATNGVKWAALPAATQTFVGACAYSTTAQTGIANNTATALNWNNEDYDTDGFHDNSTNNSRMTIPAGKGGYYAVVASMAWNSGVPSSIALYIYKNGSVWNANYADWGAYPVLTVNGILPASAGDYIEIYVKHQEGVNKATDPTQAGAKFAIAYLGA